MPKQPVRVCAVCGIGVAPQSSFRRSFQFRTEAGRHFVVVGHLCTACRAKFKNEDEAARFLEAALPDPVRPT
jgi:hypothetical protein